jgi:FixJ family two-component response regulator
MTLMVDTQPVISIVDDDFSVRRALSRLVRLAGYAVESFASAPEFLASAPGGRTACLVLDIHLNGGMSGFDLQERLVADGVTIPTIFITAHGDARTRERVKQSGVAGILSKPFGDQALLDLIRRATCPA